MLDLDKFGNLLEKYQIQDVIELEEYNGLKQLFEIYFTNYIDQT